MPLTDTRVRRTRPTERDQFLADGQGLYLRIRPNGRRVWVLKSQRGGRTQWTTLGTYPALSLAEARQAAEQQRRTVATPATTQAVWAQYHAHLTRTTKRPDIVAQQVEANLLPRVGALPITRVTRRQIAAAVQAVADRGALTSARRTLTYAKQLWRYALSQGYVHTDVTADMRGVEFGGRERSRERFLDTEELRTFVRWLRHAQGTPTQLALALLLLTGQRASEVIQFHPEQVRHRWWTIPATATKQRRVQRVYLSPPAWAVVRWARRTHPQTPFACSLYGLAQATRRFAQREQLPPFTPHDLRRTMSTHLAELGAAPHVVEHMLGHRLTGVLAAYNWSTYDAERQAAWRLWGTFLRSL